MQDDVVDNPTGEDLSIDNVVNGLYDQLKTPEDSGESEGGVEEVVEEQEEVSEDDKEQESFEIPKNVPKELQEAIDGIEDTAVKQASLDIFKKMQGNFTKKNQEFAEQKKFAESVNEAFEAAGLKGGDVKQKQQLITNYLSFDRLIESDPKRAVEQLMVYAKVDPRDFIKEFADPTDDSDSEFYTETEKSLLNKVETLTKKLESIEKQSLESVNQQRVQSVQEFREAKDESGNLLHPHFDAVKNEMMDLAEVNPHMKIGQLYEKAVRLNDDIYQETLEAAKQRAIQEREARRQAEIEKAKKQNRHSRGLKPQDTNTHDADAIFEKLAIDAGF